MSLAPQPRLIDLLAYNARHHPQQIALRMDEIEISNAALLAHVSSVQQRLGTKVGPGDRVALWLHNSIAWVASFIAINALGAVSVPLSTRLTVGELLPLLADSGTSFVITTSAYRGRDYLAEICEGHRSLGHSALDLIDACDDVSPQDWPLMTVSGPALDRGAPPPAGTLCIQYTSGTTSFPKGVMLSTANYLDTARYVARCQRLTPSSQFVSGAPFFHCSGTMHAITTSLVAGCTLSAMSRWDPERFVETVARYRCTVAHMIYFRDVLALASPQTRAKLASLDCAHDLGTPDFLMRIHDELGVRGISNIYGMTETAGQFTMWYPDDPLELRVSANGRPQLGNQLRIVDPVSGAVLGPDRLGEIQMQGHTIAASYFRRPEATAEAFTADGWLRSGDMGSLSETGVLRYQARLKEIIRTGGENFAPAEVEQALRNCTGLTQVCVLGIEDPRLDEVPVAVLVGASGMPWEGVMATLKRELAGYKLPRAIYVAEDLPLTATNRVQRPVLKQWITEGRLTRVA